MNNTVIFKTANFNIVHDSIFYESMKWGPTWRAFVNGGVVIIAFLNIKKRELAFNYNNYGLRKSLSYNRLR